LKRAKGGTHASPAYRTRGIRPENKRVMMQKITEAVDQAYHIGAWFRCAVLQCLRSADSLDEESKQWQSQ